MKKTVSVALTLILTVVLFSGIPAGAESYSQAVSIWPMDADKGVWYTEKYSTSNYIYDTLESDSIKHLNIDISNQVWRASASAFSQRSNIYSDFIFVNGGAVVDLSSDSWLYYDFTMQNAQWSLSLTLGIDGNNSYDISVPLQRAVCEAAGITSVTSIEQYGVSGVFQGKINLNDAIANSGKNNFGDIDLVGQRVHIISGVLSYAPISDKDVMEIRSISVGRGDFSFTDAASELEPVPSAYIAENVRQELSDSGSEGIDLLSDNYTWKVSTSATETGNAGSWSSFLNIDFSDGGLKLTPTGKSALLKAYTSDGTIGWPKAAARFDEVQIFTHGSYLVYDFTAQANWDILLHFNGNRYAVGLADILCSIDTSNNIQSIEKQSGTRGIGIPGAYSGVIDLEQVINFYMSHFGYALASFGYYSLSGITFIYENTVSADTSFYNNFRSLKIVRNENSSLLDSIGETTELTTGVYRPEREVDTKQAELKELYQIYSSLPEEKYTSESFQALSSALLKVKDGMNGISLDQNGEWLFCIPGKAEFCTQDYFRQTFPLYADPVLYTYDTQVNGRNCTRLKYNQEAIGIYSKSTNWGQIMTEYKLLEPVTVDFKKDVFNLDILFKDDTHPLETGNVWLVFENLGMFDLNIPHVRCMDINGGGEYVRFKFSTYMDRLPEEDTEYLKSNGYSDRLIGIVYQNSSVYGGNEESNPNPVIEVYGATLSKPEQFDTLKETLLSAVSDLKTDEEWAKQELFSLYDTYADTDLRDYTAESAAAFKTVADKVKSAREGLRVKTEILTEASRWKLAGSMAEDELLVFRTAEDFKARYPDYADNMPFDIIPNSAGAAIDFNENTIGFYKGDAPYWGIPMVKYDISDSPQTLDFNTDAFSVDISWAVEGMNLCLKGSVALFFEGIGSWIELSDISGDSIAGDYRATVELSDYYASLSADSTKKAYLDEHSGKDRLTGIVFRFGDIFHSNQRGLIIYANSFARLAKPDYVLLLNEFTEAADRLAESPYGDVNGDGKTDSADLAALRKVLLGIDYFERADVNRNGRVDIIDLISLKKSLS